MITSIEKEADLCAIFIREFNSVPGWKCYPEAAGFDVLVVHEDGRQIGVEAKMALNAKVADQILPNRGDDLYGRPGPDYRLVIVSKITDASAGIVKMLECLGVRVLLPRTASWTANGDQFTFDLSNKLLEVSTRKPFYDWYMFDWNPSDRCPVPILATNLPAGVPSPIRLTPWKESALKVIAQLRSQGFITAKQIAGHGVGVTAWTQAPGNKPAWLAKGAVRGTWVETPNLPAFDKQHPEVYALAVEALVSAVPQLGMALPGTEQATPNRQQLELV
ncbi:hypothetical protein [Pseudomonas sp. TWP3-2]|uniref:hypothetical protein n=1 Tax=Pseudomonas sp. TWP3-2 TaxID=2804574 RepID=UPI003CE9BACA